MRSLLMLFRDVLVQCMCVRAGAIGIPWKFRGKREVSGGGSLTR